MSYSWQSKRHRIARSDTKYKVFEYIAVHCNRKRLYSKPGYKPDAFEAEKSLNYVSVKYGQDHNNNG